MLLGRLCVFGVAVIAMLLALDSDSSVLQLVSFAWAGFGASFGPIVLLSLYWRKLTNWGALAAMIVGAATVFGWSAASGGIFELYELLPGFVFAMVTGVVVSLATYRRDEAIEEQFTTTASLMVVPKK